jgi:hypothetical protein
MPPHYLIARNLIARKLPIKGQKARRFLFRLDYICCVLKIFSTILVGKRYWQGFGSSRR